MWENNFYSNEGYKVFSSHGFLYKQKLESSWAVSGILWDKVDNLVVHWVAFHV